MTASHEELESLLGPYALHAVEDDEAVMLEAHVGSCPRCRAELRGYLQAAPLLGYSTEEAPAGLWEEVASIIGDRRPAPMPPQLREALGRRWRWFLGPPLAVGFTAVVVVLGTLLGTLSSGVIGAPSGTPAEQVRDAVSAALSGPHHTVKLRAAGGRVLAEVVIVKSAQAFLVPVAMPRLPSQRTYQLWAAVRGGAVSLGTLGFEAQVVGFHFESAMRAFMITAEPEGGVVQPDSAVLALGRVVV